MTELLGDTTFITRKGMLYSSTYVTVLHPWKAVLKAAVKLVVLIPWGYSWSAEPIAFSRKTLFHKS
jgi:hypothetical protein